MGSWKHPVISSHLTSHTEQLSALILLLPVMITDWQRVPEIMEGRPEHELGKYTQTDMEGLDSYLYGMERYESFREKALREKRKPLNPEPEW